MTSITPRIRLNEERNLDLIKRDITGYMSQDSNTADNYEIDDIVSKVANRQKDITFSDRHNVNTQAIYTAVNDILSKRLNGIEFKVVYKLAESDNNGLPLEDIYDIEILSVDENNAAYIIHNIDKEVKEGQNGKKMIILDDVIRKDLFDIIISSEPFKEAMGVDVNYLKVILK